MKERMEKKSLKTKIGYFKGSLPNSDGDGTQKPIRVIKLKEFEDRFANKKGGRK